mmetsp:Transcript_43204/g.41551  ORF Transcript_43204/g.41551 Transcript_43204/m.41551 type:complete len:230 (-) Transcript_43204:256-945(-)
MPPCPLLHLLPKVVTKPGGDGLEDGGVGVHLGQQREQLLVPPLGLKQHLSIDIVHGAEVVDGEHEHEDGGEAGRDLVLEALVHDDRHLLLVHPRKLLPLTRIPSHYRRHLPQIDEARVDDEDAEVEHATVGKDLGLGVQMHQRPIRLDVHVPAQQRILRRPIVGHDEVAVVCVGEGDFGSDVADFDPWEGLVGLEVPDLDQEALHPIVNLVRDQPRHHQGVVGTFSHAS